MNNLDEARAAHAVTLDYRDVLGEVCHKRLNNPALGAVFPGFSVTMRGFLKG